MELQLKLNRWGQREKQDMEKGRITMEMENRRKGESEKKKKREGATFIV